MSDSSEILMASSEHFDLLTQLAAGFRDQLGRLTPTNEELSASIHGVKSTGTQMISSDSHPGLS